MKKKTLIITLIILFNIMLLPLNAYAESCSYTEINEYQKELENVYINIEYAGYYRTSGISYENYFYIEMLNMPDGYSAYMGDNLTKKLISNDYYGAFSGGVYTIMIFNDKCSDAIKTYQVRIPYYMNYCVSEGLCDDTNASYDGTVETKDNSSNDDYDEEDSVRGVLIIILVALIVILLACILILWKRKSSKRVEL